MRKSFALMGAVVLAAGAVAIGQVTQSVVRGRLSATDDGDQRGKFHMVSKERRNTVKEKMRITASGLDATRDDDGDRPVYDVWLIDADENEADFGDVRLNRRGNARFRWSSRGDDYPDGVDALTDFSEGTIEIRDGDGNAVLDGDIPEFLGLTDDNSSGSHAATRAKAKSRLRPDDDSSIAEGRIQTKYVNRPRGVRELYDVWLYGLASDAGPYDVIAIDGETEIDLGEIDTAGRRGKGRLHVDTKDGDDIPGDGSILDLSRLDVEVRDAEGDVVLSGKFPRIE